ncbi:MAG TPA: alpha/beta hydrolase [Kiritimatiellia bacterium]|nr:alpha/beta hydrolase [Kiritimatiellia bacterium]
MPRIRTSRLGLFYQQSGEGDDIVMVHGLAANLAFWFLKIVPFFTDTYRVTAYDQRGHGMSETPPDHYTTHDLAEDLLSLLDALNIEKAHLVGHSIGGAVCAHFATLFPHRVKTLTLIECRLHAFQPIQSRDNQAFWEKHAKEFEAQGITIPKNTPKVFYSLMQELSPLADQGLINPNAVPGLILRGPADPKSRSGQRWLKLVSETTFATDLQELAGLTEDRLATIHHPTLVMYGATSHFIGSCHGLERVLPNKSMVILPDRGHFFPVTEPSLVAHHTLNFLKSLSSPSS